MTTSHGKSRAVYLGIATATLAMMVSGCSKTADFSKSEDQPKNTQDSAVQMFSGSLDCGTLTYFRKEQRLVAVQGITCEDAKALIAASAADQPLPGGWTCSLGRDGSTANLSCYESGSDGGLALLQNPDLPLPTGR